MTWAVSGVVLSAVASQFSTTEVPRKLMQKAIQTVSNWQAGWAHLVVSLGWFFLCMYLCEWLALYIPCDFWFYMQTNWPVVTTSWARLLAKNALYLPSISSNNFKQVHPYYRWWRHRISQDPTLTWHFSVVCYTLFPLSVQILYILLVCKCSFASRPPTFTIKSIHWRWFSGVPSEWTGIPRGECQVCSGVYIGSTEHEDTTELPTNQPGSQCMSIHILQPCISQVSQPHSQPTRYTPSCVYDELFSRLV